MTILRKKAPAISLMELTELLNRIEDLIPKMRRFDLHDVANALVLDLSQVCQRLAWDVSDWRYDVQGFKLFMR